MMQCTNDYQLQATRLHVPAHMIYQGFKEEKFQGFDGVMLHIVTAHVSKFLDWTQSIELLSGIDP